VELGLDEWGNDVEKVIMYILFVFFGLCRMYQTRALVAWTLFDAVSISMAVILFGVGILPPLITLIHISTLYLRSICSQYSSYMKQSNALLVSYLVLGQNHDNVE
jgi:hypothetical protein